MQMHHVDKVSSVKTKITVSLQINSVTGLRIWLGVAFIFLSFVFEKTKTANGKKATEGKLKFVTIVEGIPRLFFGKRLETLSVHFRLLNCDLR